MIFRNLYLCFIKTSKAKCLRQNGLISPSVPDLWESPLYTCRVQFSFLKSELDGEDEESAICLEKISSDANFFPNLRDSHSQFMK